jgi:PAS domain S-box-containing protein
MPVVTDALELAPWRLLDAVDDGIGLADVTGRVRWVNAALARGTRHERFSLGEDLSVALLRSFEIVEGGQALRSGLNEVLRGRSQRFELPLRHGAPPHWASLVIVPYRVGSERWALFRLSDATAVRAGDVAVLESEARWRRLVDGSPDIVFITDESSRMIYANHALEEQTGYGVEDFQVPQVRNEFIHAADREAVAAFLTAFVESDETYSDRIENRFVTKDGRVLWYSSVVSKTQYRGLPALQFVVHNVTVEHLAVEESARLLEEARSAVRSRDEFLQIAAHELKTPITSLRGFCQWLYARHDMDAKGRDRALSTIDRQAAKLARLVERLLDVSRLRLGHLALSLERADLVTIVREAIASVARPSAAPLALDAPASLPAQVDPVRIEQVVTNLVDNAFRHGSPVGPVEVAVRPLAHDRAEISVCDHGPGVPQEERERIFERFYRAPGAPSSGLGLGLSISREIVALHGGSLIVESGAGAGACFRVTLPTGLS